ncbi:MAG: hypothetical protein WC269_05615, partial [Candidatus Gracilibacteria bacterium]
MSKFTFLKNISKSFFKEKRMVFEDPESTSWRDIDMPKPPENKEPEMTWDDYMAQKEAEKEQCIAGVTECKSEIDSSLTAPKTEAKENKIDIPKSLIYNKYA